MAEQDRSDSNVIGIHWRDWSRDTFDEASQSNRLVLLDLSAVWCHWCHVMDETTYSDPEIVKTINKDFVPVRVDIDKRPDISERYNRGGFPTTAFLSDLGESVWGATYVPPADMKRVIKAILRAKASGEIDSALERGRLQYLDISKSTQKKQSADDEFLATLFEDIFAAYDVEFGGFGVAPKFPHPEVVDLLLQRYSRNGDNELATAVSNTLDRMTEGLFDELEGGIFRYSVTRDWREPHYEKMLETNTGFLRNLVHAYKTLGQERFATKARGLANYILKTLRDPIHGGFYGSQDADEEFYRLTAEDRSKRAAPAVDRTIFAGWNAEAVVALLEAGIVLRERDYIDAALVAWRYSVQHLWNEKVGLVRHMDGQDLYLFADQAPFFESLLAILQLSVDDEIPAIANRLVDGVNTAFAGPEGGFVDIMRKENEIGELASPRRSLPENSKWARALALHGMACHAPQHVEEAREILKSFAAKEVENHGLFAASYISAWWALERGPLCVEVHDPDAKEASESELWLAASEILDPGVIVTMTREKGLRAAQGAAPFAVVCTPSGCSRVITNSKDLSARLSHTQSSQV